MNAAASRDLAKVSRLVSDGADVREIDKYGRTALYEAIERHLAEGEGPYAPEGDNLPVVRALLRVGADPNEVEIGGMSALGVSLTRDYANPEVTLELLHVGARIPEACGHGDSLLSLAVQDSSIEVVRELIVRKEPVNCQDERGRTALYWAATNGWTAAVDLLLKGGADPRLLPRGDSNMFDVARTTNPEPGVQAEFAKTRGLLARALDHGGA
jgi:ankyrin repeat protein